ncbi:MAG: SDR family oxidoreductase, partial [Planctomycetota bacterium]|nr:SDR family oxidoreductase [Planctomycetota bacterium]
MSTSRPTGNVQFDNTGRVVVVTGGASGIGRAIAERFLATRANVAVFDVADDLAPELPDDILYQHCDVSDAGQVQKSISELASKWDGIDVLVNNAAIQPVESFVPLDQLQPDLWRKILDVNVTGYTLMAQAVLPIMIQQNSGVLVNLASAQAHRTAREVPAYGPSKAANLMQAKQWAIEYARHGIRAVSVSPGAIDTPLVRASLEMQGGEAQLANRHPLGRLGKPSEIANAVVWLASVDASFVTATDLEVDGGLGGYAAFA